MTDDLLPTVAEDDSSALRIPKVITQYSPGYKPPFNVTRLIERMLESVPPKYLVGLSEVVLTNASGLSRERRRSVTKSRKKKSKIVDARGLYYPAWQGRRAWIEIFVDNTLRSWEKGFWLKIPLLRDSVLDEVLFHEIGHHIHYTVRPEYREKEDVADVWKVRLQNGYYRRRLKSLRVFVRIIRFLVGPIIEWLHLKVAKWRRQKGWISQGEFEESTRKKPRN